MDILTPIKAPKATITATYPEFLSQNVVEGKYYVHDHESHKNSDVRVACAGMEVCQQTYSIDRKGFKYFAIEYIASGSCELELNGEKHEISSGCCFVYGPNTPHKITSVGESSLKKYFVDFDGADALVRMKEFNLFEGTMFYIGEQRWVQDIFDQFVESGELPRNEATPLVKQLLKLLFVRLRIDQQKPGIMQSFSNETFTHCWRYIHEHYLETNTIVEVADACSVNKVYVARLFKRYAKETPFKLLTRLKIKHAGRIILMQNLPVKQVGALVGYDDPYHFSRVFKRVMGISPKNYAYLIKRGALQELP